MARYRKKPIAIEAVQWTGQNLKEIMNFVGSSLECNINDAVWRKSAEKPHMPMSIMTLEGPVNVTVGDYIIKGFKGEFYPCKKDVFNATYEKEGVDD